MSYDKPTPVIAPNHLLPNDLQQDSWAGTAASIKMIPQRQYDPDKHLAWDGKQWTPHLGNFVVQFLSGQVATADKLNAEIIPWDRYDPFANKLKGLMGGWFPMDPPDHPVYVRLPDGSVVSPDRIQCKLAKP